MRRSYQSSPRAGAYLRLPVILRALVLGGLAVSVGCGHSGVASRPRAEPRLQEPLKLVATPGPWGARAEAYDAESLFRQANLDLKAGHHQAAAETYDRLLTEFPGTRVTAPTLYNAGLAYEGLRRFADAAARYQLLLGEDPAGLELSVKPPLVPPLPAALRPTPRDVLDARFRLGLCLGEAGAHQAAAALYQALLQGADLSAVDRIEAQARRGHELLALGALSDAEALLLRVTELAREASAAPLEVEEHAALAQHDLGEVSLRYFRALPLRLPQAQLEQDLEQKARLLLFAQGRLIDVIRRRHPRWAPSAGFQLGALYREMYEAILAAPLPAELDTEEKQQLYRDELRGKLRGLLERARRVHERNLALSSFLGDRDAWAQRSAEQLADLDRLLEGKR